MWDRLFILFGFRQAQQRMLERRSYLWGYKSRDLFFGLWMESTLEKRITTSQDSRHGSRLPLLRLSHPQMFRVISLQKAHGFHRAR